MPAEGIEQLREAIRTEGRASTLMGRLDRRANASNRRLARATVLDPMEEDWTCPGFEN